MELEYKIEDLLVGYMTTMYCVGGNFGTMSTVMGPYIFYKVKSDNNLLYKEVFTEDYYQLSENINMQKFGKTYINKAEDSIESYLTENELQNGYVSKMRIVEIYKNANLKAYERQKFQQKIKILSK